MPALVHALGLGKRRIIMPRLGLRSASLVCARLAVAILILGSAIDRAASAGEDCSNGYKICNGACDRPIEGTDKVFACKSGCDFRLIACDRQPMNAHAPGENRRALRGAPMKVLDVPAAEPEAR